MKTAANAMDTSLVSQCLAFATNAVHARRREEFLKKKLNFSSSISSSASDSPADISPSATTVETTPVAATDATSNLAPEVAPLPSPSEQKAKSDQVQEEFPLGSVEVSLPRRSYLHVTVAHDTVWASTNWGLPTKEA